MLDIKTEGSRVHLVERMHRGQVAVMLGMAALCAVALVCLLLAPWIVSTPNGPTGVDVLLWLMCIGVFSGMLLPGRQSLVGKPLAVEFEIHPESRALTRRERTIYGTRDRTIPFSEIADVQIRRPVEDYDGADQAPRAILTLTSGEPIDLQASASYAGSATELAAQWETATTVAATVRKALGLPALPRQPI